MAPWPSLIVAILFEVVGTTALKASDGFSRLGPTLLSLACYGGAFYCLSLAMKGVPVGVAYAVWSGLGVLLVTLAAWALYGERIDAIGLLGLALIVAGVLILRLGSGSV